MFVRVSECLACASVRAHTQRSNTGNWSLKFRSERATEALGIARASGVEHFKVISPRENNHQQLLISFNDVVKCSEIIALSSKCRFKHAIRSNHSIRWSAIFNSIWFLNHRSGKHFDTMQEKAVIIRPSIVFQFCLEDIYSFLWIRTVFPRILHVSPRWLFFSLFAFHIQHLSAATTHI